PLHALRSRAVGLPDAGDPSRLGQLRAVPARAARGRRLAAGQARSARPGAARGLRRARPGPRRRRAAPPPRRRQRQLRGRARRPKHLRVLERRAMATTSEPSAGQSARELVPFRVRTANGREVELEYSSPRAAEGHDELAVLETLPWFEPGKPLRNYMLHETDFYEEVEQIWGRRWGAEGIGTLREVLVSRPTENEVRAEYADEWQYYYSSAAGNADLGRLQAQFDEYYAVLADNGVRVNYIEPPVPAIGAYGWIKNLVTLAGCGLVVHGGAILHRYGLGSWQKGREVIWEQTLAALQVPIYMTIHANGVCEPGAGRGLDSKKFGFNHALGA